MEMLGKVRRMHLRDGMSRSEIARRTGLSRNTVKKWLKGSALSVPKYRRSAVASKLEAYVEQLEQALVADAKRPKKDRRTAKALFAQIKAAGYAGGYTVVSNFARAWRQGAGQ